MKYKFFLILFYLVLITVLAFADQTVNQPLETVTHNGNAQKADGAYTYFEIKLNSLPITTALPEDFTYFIEAEKVTNDLSGVVGFPFIQGYYQTIGNVDAAGNPSVDEPRNCWIDVNAVDGTAIGICFDAFGGGQTIKPGADGYTLTVNISYTDASGEKIELKKVFAPTEWAYDAVISLELQKEMTFSIAVDPTSLAFCQGTEDKSVNVILGGITGNATIAVINPEISGPDAFDLTYASVEGTKIKISPNCPAGTYKVGVAVEDDMGTPDDTSDDQLLTTAFDLTVYPRPEVAITTDPAVGATEVAVCGGSTLALSATATGGTPDYVYKWVNNQDPTDINMNVFSKDSAAVTGKMGNIADGEARMYTVYVEDANGCQNTDSVTARSMNAPNITLYLDGSARTQYTVCKGAAVELEVRPAESLTFAWKDDNTNTSASRTVTVNGDTTFTVTATNAGGCSTSITRPIKINPKPEIQLTRQPDSVCLGNPLDLSTALYANKGDGGTLTYSYYDAGWNALSSATIPATDLITAGTSTYWLVGKTAQGCSDSVELTAKVNSLPTKPAITGPTVICQNQTVVLKTTPGMAGYSWSNGTQEISTKDSVSVSPINLTHYTVVVKDANGCESEASDQHTITVNTPPKAEFAPYTTEVCSGGSISLSATVSEGLLPYKNYTWSNDQGSVSVNELDSTRATVVLGDGKNTITLTVTDQNGCKGGGNIAVKGNYMEVDLGSTSPATLNGDVTLVARAEENGKTAAPGSGKYKWTFSKDPGTETQVADNNQWTTKLNANTLFKVRVEREDLSCCWAEDTFRMIPQATALILNGNELSPICYNETNFDDKRFIVTATGGVPTYTYSWTYPDWLTVEEAGDTLKITGINYGKVGEAGLSTNTLVSCKVTDSDSPTASFKTHYFKITINPYTRLKINTKTDGEELRVCEGSGNGQQYTLTASGALTTSKVSSYEWIEPAASAGTTNPLEVSTAVADADGTVYKVTGKDEKGCQTDTVGVTLYIDSLPLIQSLTAQGNVSQVCPGTSVDLTVTASGTAPLTYTWNTGGNGTHTTVTPTATDTLFTVAVTDKHGCIERDTIFIKNYIQDTIKITPAIEALCEGDSVELTVSGLTTDGTTAAPGTSYSWSGGELAAPVTGLTLWAKPVTVGKNTYTVTSVDGQDGHGCAVVEGTAEVTLNAKPVLVITDPAAVCEPGTVDLTAAAVTAGSTLNGATLSYYTDLALTNVLTGANAVSTSGTYYIKATTTSGCWDMDSVHVVVSPRPTVVVKDVAVCAPNTVDLSVDSITEGSSEGLTYTYYTDVTATNEMASPVVSMTGDYYIVGTAPGNCSDTAKVHIDIHAIPTVTLAADTNVCENAPNVQITAGGATSYEWLAPDALVTSDPTLTTVNLTLASDLTTVTVAGTANGCSDTVSINIHRIALPKVSIDGPTAGCSNEVIALAADTTGLTNGPFEYVWTRATATTANAATATLRTTDAVVNDTIKVHLKDRYGCEGPDSLLIVQVNGFKPTLSAQFNGADIEDQVAPNTSVDLVAGPAGNYEYKFLKVKTPADSLIEDWAAASTINYTVTQSATYKVLVRNTDTGCTDSATVVVSVLGEALSITGDSVGICYQAPNISQAVAVQAQGGRIPYTYTWGTLDGLTLEDVTDHPERKVITSVAGLNVGKHELMVKVEDTYGVSDTAYVKITINALPTIRINGEQDGADIDSCQYTTAIVLTASGETSPAGGTIQYKWQTPAGWEGAFSATASQTVDMTAAGAQDYKVVGQDQYGCQDTATRRVMIHPVPVVTLELSGDTCRGSEVTLTAHASAGTLDAGQLYTYSWTGAAVTAEDSVATAVLADNANHFEVEITDSKGCQTTVSRDVNVAPLDAVLAANPASMAAGQSSTLIASPNGDGTYTYEFLLVSESGATSLTGAVDSSLSVSPTQTTDYKVVVTNAAGCSDTSEVATVTITGEELALKAAHDTICAVSGEEYVLESGVTGGSGAKTYEWRSLDAGAPAIKDNKTDEQNLTVVLAGETGGAYRYEIEVTDGALSLKDTASLYLNVKPEIASLEVLDSCSNFVKLKVTMADPALTYSYEWNLSLGMTNPGLNEGDDPAIRTFGVTNADGKYTVGVVAKAGSCQDSTGVSGSVLDLGLSFDLLMSSIDTCGNVSELPVDARHSNRPGSYKVDYEYTPWGGTAQSITHDFASGANIPASGAGIYRMIRYYNDQYPGCALELQDSVNVDSMPATMLPDDCFALNKDSIFNLSVENSTNYNYIWHAAEYDGSAWTDVAIAGDATQSTITGQMGDKDLQYTIEISSKNLAACKAVDTAYIYRIPDAPVIDIDTVNDRYHAQITWTAVNGAEGYTVWSRKWDPYCLTKAYTGDTLYHEEPTATNINALSWAEPNMDSLKFFYVTATRQNICGSMVQSLPSADTVGYKLDSLYINTDNTSNNPITLVFENKYFHDTKELLKWVQPEYSTTVFWWDMASQATSNTTFRNPDWDELLPDYTPEQLEDMGIFEYVDVAPLEVSKIYFIAAAKKSAFLQFGKLPSLMEYRLENTETSTSNNIVSLLLQKSYYSGTINLFKGLTPSRVDAIRLWNFASQAWTLSTNRNPDWDALLPDYTPEQLEDMGVFEYDNSEDYRLYPALPVQISYVRQNDGSSYIWK